MATQTLVSALVEACHGETLKAAGEWALRHPHTDGGQGLGKLILSLAWPDAYPFSFAECIRHLDETRGAWAAVLACGYTQERGRSLRLQRLALAVEGSGAFPDPLGGRHA